MHSQEMVTNHMPKTFGLWSALSLGWLTLNAFGGMSFILFVGLNAGGIPTILYGYIGSSAAVLCIILTFAQCASRFATAGRSHSQYHTFRDLATDTMFFRRRLSLRMLPHAC